MQNPTYGVHSDTLPFTGSQSDLAECQDTDSCSYNIKIHHVVEHSAPIPSQNSAPPYIGSLDNASQYS